MHVNTIYFIGAEKSDEQNTLLLFFTLHYYGNDGKMIFFNNDQKKYNMKVPVLKVIKGNSGTYALEEDTEN